MDRYHPVHPVREATELALLFAVLLPVGAVVLVTAHLAAGVRAISRWIRQRPTPDRIATLTNEQIDELRDVTFLRG
jgi:hypothetical protein